MLTKKEPLKNKVKTTPHSKNANALSAKIAENASAKKNPTGNYPQSKPHTYSTQKNPTKTKKSTVKTELTIHYDVGFSNFISIRGQGANLNWDKGQSLKNVKANEWKWECDESFDECQYKILINDCIFEQGENQNLKSGDNITRSPQF